MQLSLTTKLFCQKLHLLLESKYAKKGITIMKLISYKNVFIILFYFLLWNYPVKAQVSIIKDTNLKSNITALAITRNGRFLFTGDEEGYIKKWNTNKWNVVRTIKAHSKIINDIQIYNDTYLLSASSDNSVKLLDVGFKSQIREFSDHTKWVYSSDISKDRKCILTASADNTIKIWSWNVGSCINTITYHNDWVNEARYNYNSDKIISISEDQTIKIIDAQNGNLIKSIPYKSGIKKLDIHPNDKTFACGTDDGKILNIDINTQKIIKELSVGNGVTDLKFTNDGIYLFVSTVDGTIKVIDVEKNEIKDNFQAHDAIVNKLIISNDSKILVTAGQDKRLKIWDIKNYSVKYIIKSLVLDLNKKLDEYQNKLNQEISILNEKKKRGEFEAIEEYQIRMVELENYEKEVKDKYKKKADEYTQYINHAIEKLTNIEIPIRNVEFELEKYNPDEEYFSVIVENNKYKLYISRTYAKDFKENKKQIICNGTINYNTAGEEIIRSLTFETSNGQLYNIGKSTLYTYAPPNLQTDFNFQDINENGILEAGENAKVIVKITNKGEGSTYALKAFLMAEENYHFLDYPTEKTIYIIKPSEVKEIIFDISASDYTPDGICNFKISFSEENGFEPGNIEFSFNTKKYEKPDISIEREIFDQNNNDTIEPQEIIKVITRVINKGGPAYNVKIDIINGENVFFASYSKNKYEFDSISKNEYRDFEFSFYVNEHVQENIPLSLKIEADNFFEIYEYSFVLEKVETDYTSIIITLTPGTGKIESLIPDVDKNIPETDIVNENAIAVVIGNCNYKDKDIGNVDFAIKDAKSIKEYLIKTLGYKSENILFYRDIDKLTFETIFGSKNDYKGRLYDYVIQGKSDIFVYYCGHGVPDIETKRGYIAPVNCNSKSIKLSCYPLQTLYDNLSKLDFKSLVVVIDACFSGGSHSGRLIKYASPIIIKIEQPIFKKQNYLTITAASSDQIASWYPEKQHSLFTYYFLKGIQGEANTNKDKNLTYFELKSYLIYKVPYMARRLYGRDQEPEIYTDHNQELVKYK